MHAVTARAVGHLLRVQLRGEAVIAVEVRAGAAARHIELLRQLDALVTLRARRLRQRLRGDRRSRINVRLDHMYAVTIRADRRLRIAATDGLAVNALHKLLRDVRVALAAGLRHIEFEDG